MRRLVLLFLLFLLSSFLIPFASDRLTAQQAAPTEPLRTAADRPVDVQHIRLDFNVDLVNRSVAARATLDLRTLRPIRSLTLDAVDFEVRKVERQLKNERVAVPFSHDGKRLVLDLESGWPDDHPATLVIDYVIRDPRAGLHFFGPSKIEPDVPLTVWSQGEPTTNRYWIPCFDHPGEMQTSEMFVTVSEGLEVLSNGRLVSRTANPDRSVTFHWKQEQPHVSYLITLVVGRFDIVEEKWRDLPVLYYVPKGRKDEVARTFGRTREMLDLFSRKFGIDYPWEKYAQVVVEQFTAGGMENTSATTLHDRVLHDERSMLDHSPDGLIAHELAHQWWGDLVTCRDWAHLWLNEGFASYAEALWDEHLLGTDEYAYTMLTKGRAAIAGGRDRPVVDRRYPSPGSMFDARAYPKGAYILHMLRRKLGEDVFWKGIQTYGKEHRHRSVETSDFRKTMERVSGRSLERFFYDWTERPGSPTLEVTTEYLPDTKQAKVVVKQTQTGEAFAVPLDIAFVGPWSSQPIRLEQTLDEKERTFYVALPGRPTRVDVDPDQAILGYIKENKSREWWTAQLTESPSVALRVRAAQHFGQSKQPADREALIKALASEKYWGVQSEIVRALGDQGGDVSRDALVAQLTHPEAKTRRAIVEQLGKFHRDAKVAAALKEVLRKGDASYGVESAALTAYAKLQQPDAVNVILPWLAKPSHNEVLRTAALGALGNTQDLAALDTLLSWTQRGKPRDCRIAAINALSRLSQTANPTDAQRDRIAVAVAACLDGEMPRVRRAAVSTLRDLGSSGTPALAALEALQAHDPDDGVRDLAQRAIERIRSTSTVPVELTRLREELERLRRSQEQLLDRIQRYEKIEKKGS